MGDIRESVVERMERRDVLLEVMRRCAARFRVAAAAAGHWKFKPLMSNTERVQLRQWFTEWHEAADDELQRIEPGARYPTHFDAP